MARRLGVAGVLAVLLAATAARAQEEAEPWRSPVPEQAARPRAATSGLGATAPVSTPAQRREAHKLAAAVFAKPGAAARAAQRVDAATQPDLSLVQPRAEWTEDHGGVGLGENGVEIRTPFLD